MQTFFLICLIGVGWAMAIWVVLAAHDTFDEIQRRGGRPFPPSVP
jgi:hypothetical protein